MCGIFAYLGNTFNTTDLIHGFEKIKNRGPDNSCIVNINDNGRQHFFSKN